QQERKFDDGLPHLRAAEFHPTRLTSAGSARCGTFVSAARKRRLVRLAYSAVFGLPAATSVHKSAIRARPRFRARVKQTCTRLIQHIRGLAEGEADEVPSQIATREEGRSRHAGDPDVAHEPLRERD